MAFLRMGIQIESLGPPEAIAWEVFSMVLF
jgi:hypothetical protein